MPKLSTEFLEYVVSKGRMTPGQARSTRKARIDEIASNLTRKQVLKLVELLVRRAETPTPDERGGESDDWSACYLGAGEIEFAREVLEKVTKWQGPPAFPTDNNLYADA